MTPIVFRDASILDGTGARPWRGDVRVEGQRIAALRPAGQRPATEDAQIVDCRGRTLMPGLIESHAHLSFVDQTTLQHARAAAGRGAPARHAQARAGCTSTAGSPRAFSAAATKPRLDVVARNAIDRGDHPGPRSLAASVQLTPTGGVGDLRQLHLDPGDSMYTLPCDGPVEFRRRRARRAAKAWTCSRSCRPATRQHAAHSRRQRR